MQSRRQGGAGMHNKVALTTRDRNNGRSIRSPTFSRKEVKSLYLYFSRIRA